MRAGAGDGSERLRADLNAFVRRRAEELRAIPAPDRDGHYGLIHAACARLAARYGWPEGEASAWALKIVLLTRAMVRALEEAGRPPLASRDAA